MATKLRTIKDLKKKCFACKVCEIGKNLVLDKRDPHVFASGDLSAKVIVVAQNPGREEVKKKIPLIGPSGKNLNHLLSLAGLDRKQIYITNTVKCFTPGNRPPLPEEIKHCKHFLKEELEIVKPKLALALGNYAVKYFLKKGGVSALHGEVKYSEEFDIDVFITLHPSPMNYNRNVSKEMIVSDFKKLKTILKQYN